MNKDLIRRQGEIDCGLLKEVRNPDDCTQRGTISLSDVLDELARAEKIFPRPAITPAEGFAWLEEEVDELKAEIRKKPSEVNHAKMRVECLQVAAMALRFLKDCCPK